MQMKMHVSSGLSLPFKVVMSWAGVARRMAEPQPDKVNFFNLQCILRKFEGLEMVTGLFQ